MNIQILRAIAALNVVLAHTITASESYNHLISFLGFFHGWGANGVDIFFIISGFLMLHTQFNNKKHFLLFIKLRFIRIVPLYWFVSFSLIVAYIFFPNLFRETQINIDWILKSLFFLSNIFFEKYPLVLVGWTLEYEIFFYLIFGFSLIFNKWLFSIIFIILFVIFLSTLISNYLLIEMLLGMFVAIIFQRFDIKKFFGFISLIFGIFLILISLNIEIRSMMYSRVLYWGIPSMFIVLGAVSLKGFNNKYLKIIGDSSYSIYLIQVISIPLFYKILILINFQFNADILVLCCLVFTALSGTLLYYFVEKPLITVLKSRFIS